MWQTVRPDSVEVWNDKLVRSRLTRYYGILKGIFLPKFEIAKMVSVNITLDSSEDELWREHESASRAFAMIVSDLDQRKVDPEEIDGASSTNYLDLKIELAKRIVEHCHLCERSCGVNRLKGEKGFCRLGSESLVSTSFLHMGEESVLVPSGTIFLTGCNFGPCVFCQNSDISGDPENGKAVTPIQLAKIVSNLKREGACNANWVGGSPTPHLHNILESMKYLTTSICQLWNSNFYMSKESTELLLDVIDFWLPDMKWYSNDCANKYSQVSKYWEVVSRNHQMVHDRGGGEMIVRHLVMPGHIECCTRPILTWISKNIPRALVNIMGQYRPTYLVPSTEDYAKINRRPSQIEMKEAFAFADQLGLLWKPVS
jgi:putative pyruvate formate lyase activating enzyme